MSERYLLYGVAGLALAAWLTAFIVSRELAEQQQAVAALGQSYARHLSNGGHIHEEVARASE